MKTRNHGAGRSAWVFGVVLPLIVSACAHTPRPGEEVAECGPLYQLRARQLSPPDRPMGVATFQIVTADRYENTPDIHIRLSSPTGRFYINGAPREFGFTDPRGNLVVEWHAPETASGGGGEPTALSFQALDLPGDCSLELTVDPQR